MEQLAKDTERAGLVLDFGDCWRLADVSAVVDAVSQLKSLQKLTLDFGGCSKLALS